jgi:hypothetical protein
MGISYTPQYWWDRAEEARAISEVMSGPDAKRRMLEIADRCARLAAREDGLLVPTHNLTKNAIPKPQPE